MASLTSILAKHGVSQAAAPTAPAPAPLLTAAPAVRQVVPEASAPEPQGSVAWLLEHLEVLTVSAMVWKAKMSFTVRRGDSPDDVIDPAAVVDAIKALDPSAEFDTKWGGGGGYGNKKGDRKALVQTILFDKFGAKIIAQPAEGPGVTVNWSNKAKDKIGDALKALPLSDEERTQAADALEGKISVGTLILSGRDVTVEFYENEWEGKKEFRATALTAPASNGNGHANGNGGAS